MKFPFPTSHHEKAYVAPNLKVQWTSCRPWLLEKEDAWFSAAGCKAVSFMQKLRCTWVGLACEGFEKLSSRVTLDVQIIFHETKVSKDRLVCLEIDGCHW